MKPFLTVHTALMAMLMAPVVLAGQPIDEQRALAADANVSVENMAGEINVTTWDRDELHLTGELDDQVEELEITETAGGIKIRVRNPDNQRNTHDTVLDLKVPVGANLDLEGISADITVEGSRTGHISASSVSGDVEISAGTELAELSSISGDILFTGAASRVIIETVSGDMELSGITGEATISTVSGDVEFAATELSRGRFETVSGHLDLEMGVSDGGKLTVESMSGDVELSLPATQSGEFDAQTFSGDLSSEFGQAEKDSMGLGIRLNHNEGDSGAIIRLESFSGDIEIERR